MEREPRGFRNNNFGNIRRTKTAWKGEKAVVSDPDFEEFETPEDGVRAMAKLVQNYQSLHGLDTVPAIVSRYAPSSENDTSGYANSVLERTGYKPDQKLNLSDPNQVRPLLKAMIRQENGRDLDESVIDRGIALARPRSPLPAGTQYAAADSIMTDATIDDDDPFAALIPKVEAVPTPMVAAVDDDPFAALVPQGPSPERPLDPNATPSAPLSGAGPGGRDLQWWERPPVVPKPQPREMTIPQRIGFGLQNVGRGIADVAGAPMDLLAIPANAGIAAANLFGAEMPYIEKPPLGSDSLAETFSSIYERLGGELFDDEELTPNTRMSRNITRFGTSAAIPGAALSKAAGAVKPMREGLSLRAEPFLDPYLKNPSRALATDTAAGAGAGAGVSAAEELYPDSLMATLVGALAGGSAGATGVGLTNAVKDAGVKSVKNLANGTFKFDPAIPRDPETGEPVKRKVADEAARFMQGHADDIENARRKLGEGMRFYRNNNLPMPGTGVLSNDVGLIGVERAARTEDPTPFLKRDRDVREAQGEKLRSMAPELPEEQKIAAQKFAKQSEQKLIGRAETKAAAARSDLTTGEAQLEGARQKEAEIAAPITAQRGREGEASQALDKQITEGALEPRTQAKNQAFDAIDPDKAIERDVTPIADLVTRIKERAGKLSTGEQLPSEFVSKLDKITGEGGTGKVALGDMLDARKYLNTAAEKAQSSGNFELTSNIRKLKSEINAEVDRVIAEGGPGSKEATLAKKIYEEEYAPFFAEGFGRVFRDKVQKDPTGRTQLPPSDTAKFFLNNSDEAAADLRRIVSIAKDPAAATGAVGNYVKAQLANLVKADGTLEPATLKKWLDNNRAALDEFPTVKSELEQFHRDVLNGRGQRNKLQDDLRTLSDRLKSTEKNIALTKRRINDSVLKVLIDNEPVNAAAKILSDGDPEARMQEVIKRIGRNQEAKQAFKRAVADHLESKFTGTRTEQTGDESFAVLQSKVEGFMKKPGVEKALMKLYEDTPDAMNNLKIAQRIGRDIAKINIQATSGSATAENVARNKNLMNGMEAALKLKFGMLRGGGIMRSIRLARDTIPGLNNDAAIQRLIVRAQLEPELAKHLYGRDVERMPARLWTKKLNRLIGYAAASREGTDEDEPAE